MTTCDRCRIEIEPHPRVEGWWVDFGGGTRCVQDGKEHGPRHLTSTQAAEYGRVPMDSVPLPSQIGTQVPRDGIIAVDTEGSGLHIDDGARVSIISVAFIDDLSGQLVAWAWPFDQGPVADKPLASKRKQRGLFDDLDIANNLPREEWEALLEWLSQFRHVYHKAQHDVLMLEAGTRYWPGRDFLPNFEWDTMLTQWVVEPQESSGLKNTARRLWGDDETAEMEALKPYLGPKDNPRYDLVPWEIIGPYAAKDAEQTIRLYHHQREQEGDWTEFIKDEVPREFANCRVIVGMTRRGIGYDVEAAQVALKDALGKAAMLADRLPFRPTVNEARKWFYGKQDAEPHCMTKTGEYSVAECCVRTLVAQEVAGAKEWAQYQKVTNAISRWYEGFIDKVGEDGRLRTDFRQNGTVSMRWSSQRANLQALPHDYRLEAANLDLVPPRSLFRAAPGKVLIEMDLEQAELRYGSKAAGCVKMQEAIASGDPHGVTATALFDVTPDSPRWFEFRQVGKRSNFALEYNVGPDTFMKDLEKQTGIVISRQESNRIVTTWRELYHEFPTANRRAEMVARKKGRIKMADGRYRYFRPFEELHKAFNAHVQGSIAQAVKRAAVALDAEWPDCLLLQIHDSLVAEVPEDGWREQGESMAVRLAEVASEVLRLEMPVEMKPWHKEKVAA